jgi:hypothetical protein
MEDGVRITDATGLVAAQAFELGQIFSSSDKIRRGGYRQSLTDGV